MLFVGINPGIRSAETGHHFAGYSNRFWKLLFESKLVPEAIDWRADDRLPEWGFGITNLVARETPGIDTLSREECSAGIELLRAKVRRFKPEIVAFVGVSLYRWIFGAKGAVSAWPPARDVRRRHRYSCCRIPAAGTPTSRTRKCWRHFESSDVD